MRKIKLTKSEEEIVKTRILRFIQNGWVGVRLVIPLTRKNDMKFELKDVIDAIYKVGTQNEKRSKK